MNEPEAFSQAGFRTEQCSHTYFAEELREKNVYASHDYIQALSEDVPTCRTSQPRPEIQAARRKPLALFVALRADPVGTQDD
jgi:hypothetical protein